MLDVHPPHHIPNTWRDFFLHIATIVVGLLIAIGLEQTVEYIHHRHEATETRERIRAELTEDRDVIRQNTFSLEAARLQLQTDSSILSQPAPQRDALTKLKYSWSLNVVSVSAWEMARQTDALSLLKPEEAEEYSYLYRMIDENYRDGGVYIGMIDNASGIANRVSRADQISAADRQQLLAITDQLSGSVTEQLELYTFIDASLKDWLNHN